MERFRASYSVIKAWSDGRNDDALEMYFHKKREETRQQQEGKKWHSEWQAETKKTGKLPDVFKMEDTRPNPQLQTELRIETDIPDWMSLRGVIDLYDPATGTIYDYKTGVSSSGDYAESHQIPLYAWLLAATNHLVGSKSFYMHYNQYTKESDIALVYITDKRISESVEWFVTQAADMKNHLDKQPTWLRAE